MDLAAGVKRIGSAFFLDLSSKAHKDIFWLVCSLGSIILTWWTSGHLSHGIIGDYLVHQWWGWARSIECEGSRRWCELHPQHAFWSWFGDWCLSRMVHWGPNCSTICRCLPQTRSTPYSSQWDSRPCITNGMAAFFQSALCGVLAWVGTAKIEERSTGRISSRSWVDLVTCRHNRNTHEALCRGAWKWRTPLAGDTILLGCGSREWCAHRQLPEIFSRTRYA